MDYWSWKILVISLPGNGKENGISMRSILDVPPFLLSIYKMGITRKQQNTFNVLQKFPSLLVQLG